MYLIVISYLLGCLVMAWIGIDHYKEDNRKFRLTIHEFMFIILWPVFALLALFLGTYWKLKDRL